MNPMDAIVPVVLPTMTWGNLASEKTALMVHGLGSSAATCWRVMEALASDGYCAVAPDLRGHGSAPRTTRYRIADFAADISELSPPRGGSWDVVIGHSIGAASAVVAQAQKPSWAKQLVLLDPALHIGDATRAEVLANQRLGHSVHDVPAITQLHPHWHPQDIEVKVQAHRSASLWALEQAVADNSPWDVTDHAEALTIPTAALCGEESLGSMFFGDQVSHLTASLKNFHYEVIAGAGHSPHRDKPQETLAALRALLT